MSSLSRETCSNLLLRSISADDFALLAPHLHRRPLKLDQIIAAPGQLIESIVFPERGIITFSEVMGDGTRIGIAHTGYDGFAGWPVLLACNRSPYEARVTADGGTALHISPDDLLNACSISEDLRAQLLRFVQAFVVQMGRTIVSSLIQSVETRLCRWALMAHDRIEGDDLQVTHDEIAVMLAVRRASVTDAIHVLEGDGLIRSRRGVVTIRDREGLLRRAGETYGFFEAEYSRLIAPFPPSQVRARAGISS